MKSGQATKGEVFRLLTSLQRSDEDFVEKTEPSTPPTPPTQNRKPFDETNKALSVSEFLKKSAALDEIELEAPDRKREKKKKKNGAAYEVHSFRPQIKKLPKSYGKDTTYESVEFNKRVNLWKAKKAKQIQRKKEERVMSELEDCT